MAILSKQLIQDLGIELNEQDYASLSEHFETTLQERVINEITMELIPEQAQELGL